MRINANKFISSLLLAICVALAAGCATTKPLIEAAKEGDTAAVETLLAKGVDVDARDKDGNTPLMYAVAESDTETVKALIAGGADVNAKNESGSTVLMRAITLDYLHEPNYTATIDLLLENGADVNAQDEQGMTALMHAAKGHTAWGSLMIGNNLLVTGPPTGRADLEEVYLEVVKALLARGADVNARDKEGMSALIRAAMVDYSEVGRTLIEAGAEVNMKNEIGGTALMYAVGSGNIGTVQLLLANGANVNVQANDGWTPLIVAASEGQGDIARVLLGGGADINAKDTDARTALMGAAAKGHTATVEALLESSANLEAKDKEGMTALIVAARNGHLDCVQALLNVDADVNAKNNGGGTALMLAAFNGHTAAVQALLEAGADVDAETKEGMTALTFAELEDHHEIIQLLQNAGAKEVVGSTLTALTKALQEAQTHYDRGLAYLNKEEYERAIVDFTKVIELRPGFGEAYAWRGFAYLQKHEYDRAITDLNKAIEITPGDPVAYVNRGSAFANKGDYKQAVEDLTKAIDLNPELAEAYDILAAIYKKMGREEEDLGKYEEGERAEERMDSSLEAQARSRTRLSIGGGMGYFAPMKLMGENFYGRGVTNIRFSWAQYPKDSGPSLLETDELDYFETGFSQWYVEFFQLRSRLKEEIAAEYDLDNPDALIRGVTFAFGGAPYALSLPKGSSQPLVRLAIPTARYGLGAYKFRFVDSDTFTKLGETTLTELRGENNTTNLGGFSEFGLNALLFDRVALDVNVRLEQVNRVTMVWHWITSGFIVALSEIGIETVINKLPEKWRWLYLYRIPYEIAYTNFYYNHPNWPYHDPKPLYFTTYQFGLQWRF